MKALILFTVAIYFIIAIPNSHAGIAGIITYLKGECNEPDENEVQMCSSRETGAIYYVYNGIKFDKYPNIKKD
jgi:hypothetical protein